MSDDNSSINAAFTLDLCPCGNQTPQREKASGLLFPDAVPYCSLHCFNVRLTRENFHSEEDWLAHVLRTGV